MMFLVIFIIFISKLTFFYLAYMQHIEQFFVPLREGLVKCCSKLGSTACSCSTVWLQRLQMQTQACFIYLMNGWPFYGSFDWLTISYTMASYVVESGSCIEKESGLKSGGGAKVHDRA